MVYTKKLDSTEVLDLIIKFYDEWKQYPGIGFMAGWFKVSKRLIYDKINILEKEGFIIKTKKNIKYTGYKLKRAGDL